MGSLVALWLADSCAATDIVLLGRSGRFPADSPLARYRYGNLHKPYDTLLLHNICLLFDVLHAAATVSIV